MQTQASPFHLSRGVIRSITLFFGWDICSSLSSSFGVLTACSAESLVQTSLSSLAQGHPESFHCHRVPDAFQLPLFWIRGSSSSRSIGLVRAPLVFVRYRACFLGGQVWGDFPGLCKILHETTPLCRMEPYGIPVVHTCLLSTFVGTGLRWFYFVFLVDDGSYWSTMVSGGLDLILHCWSAGTSCARVSGRGLLRQERVRRAPLGWTISILSSAACFFWLGVHG